MWWAGRVWAFGRGMLETGSGWIWVSPGADCGMNIKMDHGALLVFVYFLRDRAVEVGWTTTSDLLL